MPVVADGQDAVVGDTGDGCECGCCFDTVDFASMISCDEASNVILLLAS